MRFDIVLLTSIMTSIGSIMLITEMAPTVFRGVVAFTVQVSHDFVCIIIPYAVGQCILYPGSHHNILIINALYTLIMACFSYHKRCVLTLWFNDLIMIDKCHRYIPIWQRIMHGSATMYKIPSACDHTTAYLWLNDQIMFSVLIMMLNLNQLRFNHQKIRGF